MVIYHGIRFYVSTLRDIRAPENCGHSGESIT